MKTLLHGKQVCIKLVMLLSISFLFQQSLSGQTLSFKSPILEEGTDLEVGGIYRFSSVTTNVDALVTIEDLVNGATITSMDNNAAGYDDAFQPLIYTPAGSRTAYALFSIKFVHSGTAIPTQVLSFEATTLDLDGNSSLKEFSEIYFPGGAAFSANALDNTRISVTAITNGYSGINLDGIERTGIDTSTVSNSTSMYTVQISTVENFMVKFGTVTQASSGETRLHSLSLKSLAYIINNFQTLPVKLISFSAILNNNKVDLKWITETEINADHFVIEKSTDGIHFNNAGVMPAQGNSLTRATYNFSDNVSAINTGIIYYRLRSIDIDNKSELSETRIIRIGKQTGKNISIDTYPNPVSNKIHITIPSAWQNKKVVYEIYDVNGIVAKKVETATSSQTEAINISSLASGVYIVKVRLEGEVLQQRIFKQ